MPKETIPSAFDHMLEGGPPKFALEILWGRENGIQIATTDPLAELGSRESGLYVELDRDGVNTAIRVLRRARDQAFGKDE